MSEKSESDAVSDQVQPAGKTVLVTGGAGFM